VTALPSDDRYSATPPTCLPIATPEDMPARKRVSTCVSTYMFLCSCVYVFMSQWACAYVHVYFKT
jgi:hypothetical protein